MGLNIY